MADDFENHCWKDIVPPDVLDIYSHYVRKVFVGPTPALLAIDLYELAYQGGARPVAELHQTYASSCGEHAHAAIEPTRRLFAAARARSGIQARGVVTLGCTVTLGKRFEPEGASGARWSVRTQRRDPRGARPGSGHR